MGGAERAERRRRQQAAQAGRTAPGPERRPRGGVVAGVVIVLLVLAGGVGWWLLDRGADLPARIPVAAGGPTYPVAARDHSVVTGRPDAPVTVEVYEDFLCPGCGQFEQLYGDQLTEAVVAGQARVIYYPVAILDGFSQPPGYSSLAAGAAFCAAEAGVFPRFHDSLFAAQPREGGPGWTITQLQQLGRDLGAGDDFARCVRDGQEQRVAAATEIARERLSELRPDGRLGTPTVLVNGRLADTGDPGWLDEALNPAR